MKVSSGLDEVVVEYAPASYAPAEPPVLVSLPPTNVAFVSPDNDGKSPELAPGGPVAPSPVGPVAPVDPTGPVAPVAPVLAATPGMPWRPWDPWMPC